MKVHLVDGTYELFRAYYGAPSAVVAGTEVGATRGFLRSMVGLLREKDATHVAVAFDTVIESFRNDLFDGYKTGEGIEAELKNQFPLVERAAAGLGMTVWSMTDFEADDALAAGAAMFRDAPGVEQVVLCTPDKDLGQCVQGDLVVMRDRMRKKTLNEAAIREKFGVAPASIPDYLALVGDAADGIPGLERWGAKSAATVLAAYGHVEDVPDDEAQWSVKVRGAARLAEVLRDNREAAGLYKTLATLREDVPLTESLDDLLHRGPDEKPLLALLDEVGEDRDLLERVPKRS